MAAGENLPHNMQDIQLFARLIACPPACSLGKTDTHQAHAHSTSINTEQRLKGVTLSSNTQLSLKAAWEQHQTGRLVSRFVLADGTKIDRLGGHGAWWAFCSGDMLRHCAPAAFTPCTVQTSVPTGQRGSGRMLSSAQCQLRRDIGNLPHHDRHFLLRQPEHGQIRLPSHGSSHRQS